MRFFNASTGGHATITNDGAGIADGNLEFFDNSTAGNAQLINNAGSTVDFSGSTGPAGR